MIESSSSWRRRRRLLAKRFRGCWAPACVAVVLCLLATLLIKHHRRRRYDEHPQGASLQRDEEERASVMEEILLGRRQQHQASSISENLSSQDDSAAAAALGEKTRATLVERPFRANFVLTNREIDALEQQSDETDEAAAAAALSEALQVNSSRVLALRNVSFPVEPRWALERRKRSGSGAYADEKVKKLLIVVNSKWDNFERRARLRSSWLNPANLAEILAAAAAAAGQQRRDPPRERPAINEIDYVFAVGRPSSPAAAAARLGRESRRFGDLLVINLYENYRTMSLKHLSLVKWLKLVKSRLAAESAAAPAKGAERELEENLLVLKCDDDAQVDLSQLMALHADRQAAAAASNPPASSQPLINNNSDADADQEAGNWIMCARFPANTRALRAPSQKWRLSRAEYPFDTFPAYCSGLAYLAPLKLLRRLYALAHVLLLDRRDSHSATGGEQNSREAASFRPALWVDDVFMTGLLFEHLAERPQVLRANSHFCYTRAQRAHRQALGRPCMVWEEFN